MINSKTPVRSRRLKFYSNRNATPLRTGQAGFTLIEMLVVLVLTALMSAMMVGAIRQMRTWRQVEERAVRQAELDTLADFVAGEISGALDLPLLHVGGEDTVSMVGEPDSLKFVAVVKTGFAVSRLIEVEYALDRSADVSILKRIAWPHRPLRESDTPAPVEDLHRGVDTIRFRYLSFQNNGGHVWSDNWHVPRKIPEAVQLVIESKRAKELLASRRIAVLEK